MKITPLLCVLLLTACSQYEDGKYLCKGSVRSITAAGSTTSGNQQIAFRLESDKVSFSGNGLLSGDQIGVCEIGSNEFAKKDELFFDTLGCTTNGKNQTSRKYGTYSKLSKLLVFTNEGADGLVYGTFACDDTK